MTEYSGVIRHTTGCPTGKRAFQSRRDAKKARRLTKRGDGLSTYKCTLCPGWHNGHLAHDVKRGNIARAEMRPKLKDPPRG